MGGTDYDKEEMGGQGQIQDSHGITYYCYPVVDICKKYGLSPNTFYPWREKFIEADKMALAGGNNGHAAALQKENDLLKLPLGEYTLANNALKKPWRQGKDDCCAGSDWAGHVPAQVAKVLRRVQAAVVLETKGKCRHLPLRRRLARWACQSYLLNSWILAHKITRARDIVKH